MSEVTVRVNDQDLYEVCVDGRPIEDGAFVYAANAEQCAEQLRASLEVAE